MSYNIDEGESDNHFNCPVVAYYPELLIANNPRLNSENFLHPYMDLNVRKNVIKVLSQSLKKYNVKGKIPGAVDKAFEEMEKFKNNIAVKAQEIISQARAERRSIIVLAGRPYHIDKEINHGIHKLISSLGMAVVTEDSVAHLAHTPKLGVLNQWTYHSRLYTQLKIDEINNLGAAKIRLRSLVAAIKNKK